MCYFNSLILVTLYISKDPLSNYFSSSTGPKYCSKKFWNYANCLKYKFIDQWFLAVGSGKKCWLQRGTRESGSDQVVQIS